MAWLFSGGKELKYGRGDLLIHRFLPGRLEPVAHAVPQLQALSEAMVSSFSDEQNYLLRDAEAEVLFSFSLEESLRRAHASPLFKVCLDRSSAQLLRPCGRNEAGGSPPESRALPSPLRSRASSRVCSRAQRIDMERDALHITWVQRVCYE